jgi:hypothetical protein
VINFTTVKLDGEAHEWWCLGILTLGHSNIISYANFTQILMDKFNRKDHEVHYRELAQLRHTCTPNAHVTEFQWMAFMVTDFSKKRLVVLLIEGLDEPLRVWVKDFRPTTL